MIELKDIIKMLSFYQNLVDNGQINSLGFRVNVSAPLAEIIKALDKNAEECVAKRAMIEMEQLF